MPKSAPPIPLPPSEFDALEGMARVLTTSGWYRVMRRFEPRDRYAEDDGTPTRTALFVDVETTGRDPTADAIIELACVPFQYAPSDGRIFGVGPALVFLEDPGRPIPDEVEGLTGISDEMVRGRRIDDACVESLLERVALVIAHNASFDRRFVERRLPAFERKCWACSMEEVPWRDHGCKGTKLDYILGMTCAEFFDGHRATDDCYAGIHVLATRTPGGDLPFAQLLDSARLPTARIWACDSPFDCRETLKARGYKWNDGQNGHPRAWYRDLRADTTAPELAWLAERVYPGRPPAYRIERFTAYDRYSARV